MKIVVLGKKEWQFQDLSRSLYISSAEVSESLNRSSFSGLIDTNRKKVARIAFTEFLKYGLPYVFPQTPGPLSRGMATSHGHPLLKKHIVSSSTYVWPDFEGKDYGQVIEPLYPNQVKAAKEDEKLYEALAMLDAIRVGKVREKKFAFDYFSNLLLNEPSREHNKN
ncbi:MAG TPA: hypothetical protein PLK14_13385 [Sediminibacterium sp.]|nr:hypothetical protein [Sediminibacterium sp.]HQS56098.1 hypothetical protein [Sediminibacterium sp.]